MRALARMLPDGRRLHLQDGPIDIVLQAFGEKVQIELAYSAAVARFSTLLDELCGELSVLRSQARFGGTEPSGVVARRMLQAVLPFAVEHFITPMAAVAGAVAEEILNAMTASAEFSRAYVNDGGDIALYLSPGEQFVIGMVERPDQPSLFATTVVESGSPVRGIATSGWRGRSFSLGIADAVPVLANSAAMADAAATIIANAVDLPAHASITRVPARELAPDSDLGDLMVTTGVGQLTRSEVRGALRRGAACAESLIKKGLIRASALCLQGATEVVPTGIHLNALATPRERSLLHA